MPNFDEFHAEQMKEEELKKEYDALEPKFTIMQAMIDARNAEGLIETDIYIF